MIIDHPARELALAIADRLAHPDMLRETDAGPFWHPQSLAYGVPGIALLHIELAATQSRPWERVHDWLGNLAHQPIATGQGGSFFHGIGALAHALACAAQVRPQAYEGALSHLDRAIASNVRSRIDAAHMRIDQRKACVLAEFDLIRGLTGYGRYLLRRKPDGVQMREILSYLVRLTEPLYGDPAWPGWFTASGPSGGDDGRTPGGHANNGVAHGIAGSLCLLAHAHRQGITVAGQRDAIDRICAWFDHWRVDTDSGRVWPYWVSYDEITHGRAHLSPPQRPSWCYGTAGHARALQLAGLANDDADRRRIAEVALVQGLSDPLQLVAMLDVSLCHGLAGVTLIAATVAREAMAENAARLHAMLPALLDAIPSCDASSIADGLLRSRDAGPGLLDGAAGTALAIAACTIAEPGSGWDSCMLIV